jgi:signal transduction histidine kinase
MDDKITMTSQKSISARVFWWLFGVGMLALIVGGGGLYLEVKNIIYGSLDHTLESELEIFTGLLHIEDGELEFEYAETVHGDYIVPRSGHYFQIYIDGEIIADSLSLAGERLTLDPEQFIAEELSLQVKIYQGTGPANEPLRMMERSLVFAGHQARVIVAQTILENENMLRRFKYFLLISGVLVIFFMALIGLVISRQSLKPLKNFSTQIDHIEERSLEKRLPVDSPYQEIGHLALAFNSMLDRLKRSLENREELLSEVSHQLKTPVAVIRSHCDIYLKKKRSPTEYIEALEIIRKSADELGTKIRRLLGFAQTEAQLMNASNLTSIDLTTCLQKARTTVEPLTREPGIEITETLEPGLIVQGNSERLVEAFANLLENAVKYNQPNGKVEIVATADKGNAVISISDTGCGINQKDLDKIFQRFFRSQQTDQADGSGLGLALVKTIITAHQGQVDVTNRSEGGSTFIVTLPLAPNTMNS